MSDPTAPDRHQRHEACFADHDRRLDGLEDETVHARIWRTGNGTPHRGAEARITRLEEGAVMRDEIDAVAERVVKAYQSTVKAQVQTWGPWIIGLGVVIYTLVTGKPPEIVQ